MNIQIDIKAPELEEVFKRLVDELAWGNKLRELAINEGDNKEQKLKEENSVESKKITLEEVRERLSELSRDGHREEVKALIGKYGALKLTDVKPEYYLELMKEADRIDGKK